MFIFPCGSETPTPETHTALCKPNKKNVNNNFCSNCHCCIHILLNSTLSFSADLFHTLHWNDTRDSQTHFLVLLLGKNTMCPHDTSKTINHSLTTWQNMTNWVNDTTIQARNAIIFSHRPTSVPTTLSGDEKHPRGLISENVAPG